MPPLSVVDLVTVNGTPGTRSDGYDVVDGIGRDVNVCVYEARQVVGKNQVKPPSATASIRYSRSVVEVEYVAVGKPRHDIIADRPLLERRVPVS